MDKDTVELVDKLQSALSLALDEQCDVKAATALIAQAKEFVLSERLRAMMNRGDN